MQTIDLKKYYGTKPNITRALDGVNFSVNDGEFVAVVGTSGSGKSTLLHMMGGLDTPTSGTVIVRDKELSKMNDEQLTIFRRRNIGFIFQNYNLVPILNVYENIVLPVELDGDTVDQKFLDEIVHLLGLEDKLKNMPNNLSGGQQQRLCIARAVAVHPQVLLMDEPCSALDPISTLAVEDLINELKSDYTIVIVTHNMQQAARIADYTAFFNLKAVGQPGHPRVLHRHHHDVQQPAERRSRTLRLRTFWLIDKADSPKRSANPVGWCESASAGQLIALRCARLCNCTFWLIGSSFSPQTDVEIALGVGLLFFLVEATRAVENHSQLRL